jgi:hypothetical protein
MKGRAKGPIIMLQVLKGTLIVMDQSSYAIATFGVSSGWTVGTRAHVGTSSW